MYPLQLVLFVFALIICVFFVAIKFMLAPYVLIDKNTKIVQSLKISWNMTKGYTWTIVKIILMYCLLLLPGLIPYVGAYVALITVLFFAVAPALCYEEIKNTLK